MFIDWTRLDAPLDRVYMPSCGDAICHHQYSRMMTYGNRGQAVFVSDASKRPVPKVIAKLEKNCFEIE
jgi:hypothetical protein